MSRSISPSCSTMTAAFCATSIISSEAASTYSSSRNPGRGRQRVDGIQRRVFGLEENHAAHNLAGRGEQLKLGLGHHAERALAADKQIHEIHPRLQTIPRRVLGAARQRNRRDFEIHRLAALVLDDAAVHERDAQRPHMPPSRAIAKTPRPARVRRNVPADRRRVLRRVRRIKLPRPRRRLLDLLQQHPRPHARVPRRSVQPPHLDHGDAPAALRRRAPREPRHRPHHRNRHAFARGPHEDLRQLFFVARGKYLVGMPGVARDVRNVHDAFSLSMGLGWYAVSTWHGIPKRAIPPPILWPVQRD